MSSWPPTDTGFQLQDIEAVFALLLQGVVRCEVKTLDHSGTATIQVSSTWRKTQHTMRFSLHLLDDKYKCVTFAAAMGDALEEFERAIMGSELLDLLFDEVRSRMPVFYLKYSPSTTVGPSWAEATFPRGRSITLEISLSCGLASELIEARKLRLEHAQNVKDWEQWEMVDRASL